MRGAPGSVSPATFAGDLNYSFDFRFRRLVGPISGRPPSAPSSGLQSAYITYNGLQQEGQNPPARLRSRLHGYAVLARPRRPVRTISCFWSGPAITVRRDEPLCRRFPLGVRRPFQQRSLLGSASICTGPTSGAQRTTFRHAARQRSGAATYQVLQTPDYSLHHRRRCRRACSKRPATPGFATVTLSGPPRIARRPDDRSLAPASLGTGVNPVTGAQAYGVEAAAAVAQLFPARRVLHTINLDRRGLRLNNRSTAYYIEGSWIVSGEPRRYNENSGAYSNPVPDAPVSNPGRKITAWAHGNSQPATAVVNLNHNLQLAVS